MVADRDGDVLICPCHSGRFDPVTTGGAGRRNRRRETLPQLPITLSGDGYLVATGDFAPEAIGPGRKSRIDAARSTEPRSAYNWVDSRLDLDVPNDFLGEAFPAEDSFPSRRGRAVLFRYPRLDRNVPRVLLQASTAYVEYGGSIC